MEDLAPVDEMNAEFPEGAEPRTCGLRFSWFDAGAIVMCGAATWLAWSWLGSMALLFPVALGHFFLFCNVFRIYRKYEYIWAVVFVLNVLMWVTLARFDWRLILATQTPVTATVIILQMRSPWYHGIGARKINKRIDEFLSGGIG